MTNRKHGKESGGISEHMAAAVMFDGRDVGWLFWFGSPARFVFETPLPELKDMERIAWSSESEALRHIEAHWFALSLMDQAALSDCPPHSIDSRFEVMTVLASEPVLVDGRELGRTLWDSLSRKCVFETPLPELKNLESIAWSCPASARLHVEAFDQATREGTAAGDSIQ